MTTSSRRRARPTLAALLTGLACVAALAQPAARAPGSGFADPNGLAPRLPPADIEPVYRAAGPDQLATVRRRGVLRVGVVDVEPMAMRDARGEWVGYSIDLARRLALDLGVGVEFVPSSWSEVIPDLLGRHFDLVASGLWVTVPRALVVNFTAATAVEGVHLVAGRARAGSFKSRDDFNQPGVTIAVHAGTPQEAQARAMFPRATLLRVDDDALTPVLQGQAHALLVPTLSPQAVVAAAPDRLFLPLSQPLASASAAMAVRKGDPDFLRFLDTWILLQREQGWLDERARYWATSTEWLK